MFYLFFFFVRTCDKKKFKYIRDFEIPVLKRFIMLLLVSNNEHRLSLVSINPISIIIGIQIEKIMNPTIMITNVIFISPTN